jgi:hypothetical protein
MIARSSCILSGLLYSTGITKPLHNWHLAARKCTKMVTQLGLFFNEPLDVLYQRHFAACMDEQTRYVSEEAITASSATMTVVRGGWLQVLQN